jgi:hypothetical protein
MVYFIILILLIGIIICGFFVDIKIKTLNEKLVEVEKYIDKIEKLVNNEGIFVKDYIKYKEQIYKEKKKTKHFWI